MMTIRRRPVPRPSFFAASLLAICGIALGAGALLPTRAQPEPVAFELVFHNLAPGDPQTETGSFPLERDADLIGFSWLDRTGVMTEVELATEVCSAAGSCVRATSSMAPATFPQGRTVVRVTAVLPAPAPANRTRGDVIGRLVFVDDDTLASTGADPWLAAAWSAAAIAIGAFILAARPRGRGPTPP